MEHNDQKRDGFSYTYSAREQAELKRIREKYTPPTEEENKMERLRRLDVSVTRTAQFVALVFGIVGALILGLGMSLCLTEELGAWFGIDQSMAMVVGIVIGVLGSLVVSLAYPIYHTIVKARRKKLAPEIIRLAEELMK